MWIEQLPLAVRVDGNESRPRPVANGTAVDAQKLRGGYYTPDEMARAMARWAIRSPDAAILEPSAGDGQFVAAVSPLLNDRGRITAVEFDPSEAGKIAQRDGRHTSVVVGDFFAWMERDQHRGSFDVVLGNPPFIRYQQFREDHRETAFRLMRREGLHPTRLTNAWLPFVVAATRALRPGGRLAMVLPAELLQVTYAAELREYLVRKYAELTIVTFRKLVFEKIQQETVLLLGVRRDAESARMSFVELDGLDDLATARFDVVQPVEVDLDHAREKWTQFYLSPSELALIRAIEADTAFTRLGRLAEIDVGIVTGQNAFFVLAESEARSHGLREWCLPMIGRSAQIPGVVLRPEEWQAAAAADGRCLLLQLGDTDRSKLSAPARRYVEAGERAGHHEGYKCRIRLPRWWNVPSVWTPNAFLLRQIYDGPRIVENRAGATCTDTIHRVRVRPGVEASWLTAASINSLTYAFSEIRGRSYGGGVLELEPTEAESLPFPQPGQGSMSSDDIDRFARTRGVEATLAEVDRQFLEPAGLSVHEIEALRGIWRKLYQRRMSRKRR